MWRAVAFVQADLGVPAMISDRLHSRPEDVTCVLDQRRIEQPTHRDHQRPRDGPNMTGTSRRGLQLPSSRM